MYTALCRAVSNGEKKSLEQARPVDGSERDDRGVDLVVEEASQPVAERPEMNCEAPSDHILLHVTRTTLH
jgi:hypothetical protein